MPRRELWTYGDAARGVSPSSDATGQSEPMTNPGTGVAAGLVTGAAVGHRGAQNAAPGERGASRSGREPGEASGKAVTARSRARVVPGTASDDESADRRLLIPIDVPAPNGAGSGKTHRAVTRRSF